MNVLPLRVPEPHCHCAAIGFLNYLSFQWSYLTSSLLLVMLKEIVNFIVYLPDFKKKVVLDSTVKNSVKTLSSKDEFIKFFFVRNGITEMVLFKFQIDLMMSFGQLLLLSYKYALFTQSHSDIWSQFNFCLLITTAAQRNALLPTNFNTNCLLPYFEQESS